MKLEQGHSGLINSQMSGLNVNLGKLKQVIVYVNSVRMYVCMYMHFVFALQWLTSCERILHQSQSFQGGFCEIYKEENPLARILTTAHGVSYSGTKCYNISLTAELHTNLYGIGKYCKTEEYFS